MVLAVLAIYAASGESRSEVQSVFVAASIAGTALLTPAPLSHESFSARPSPRHQV